MPHFPLSLILGECLYLQYYVTVLYAFMPFMLHWFLIVSSVIYIYLIVIYNNNILHALQEYDRLMTIEFGLFLAHWVVIFK